MAHWKQIMAPKTPTLAAIAALLVVGLAVCQARGLDGHQEAFLQAMGHNQNLPGPLDLQQQQQLQLQQQQPLARASLELDDDDDDDDRADQAAPQAAQLAQAASGLYQQNEPAMVAADLNQAASKHYHHGHGAKGWLDMGAWTGKKGAFGWYDKHPVGKGK